MGSLLSCCGRRKKSPEHDPLLPKTSAERDALRPPKTQLDHAADILAALHIGKLPSQAQLNQFMQLLLRSNILRVGGDGAPGFIQAQGPLSDDARKVVEDARELVEAIISIGMEKNDDDMIQELVFQSSRIPQAPVQVDDESNRPGFSITMGEDPTSEEVSEDVSKLTSSVTSLIHLLITSSAFRLILSDVLLTTRELLAGAAARIGVVAAEVQLGAEELKNAASVDAGIGAVKGKTREAVGQIVDAGAEEKMRLEEEGADKVKDVVIGRVQDVIVQAHQNARYRTALSTILSILRKYTSKLRTLAISSTSSQPHPTAHISYSLPLRIALSHFKTLLERFATNRPLSPVLNALYTAILTTITAPAQAGQDLRDFFSELGTWIDCALVNAEYVTSRTGTRAAEALYDRARVLLASDEHAQWAQNIYHLLNESEAFTKALKSDRATMRLLRAVNALEGGIFDLGRDAVMSGAKARRKWREEVGQDLAGWMIPTALDVVKTLGVPRMEYRNEMVDVALDSVWLTGAGGRMVPDHLWMQNWSEVRIDMVPPHAGQTGNGSIAHTPPHPSPYTRVSDYMRLHMDGVRISAHEIGYYFKYKGLVPYTDSGILSIDVGRQSAVGEGLSVDVELEMKSRSGAEYQRGEVRADEEERLFTVRSVTAHIPGLTFKIDQSKHWILNKLFLQPLSAPIVNRLVRGIVEEQVRGAFEGFERVLRGVRKEADRTGGVDPGWYDYWLAFLKVTPQALSPAPPDPNVERESRTSTTLKGIVRTTVSQPDPGAASPPPPERTVFAMGAGAQILPGKGGPSPIPSFGDVAEGLGDTIRDQAMETKEPSKNVQEAAQKIKELLLRADVRIERREVVEERRGGWRSRAFDFGVGA